MAKENLGLQSADMPGRSLARTQDPLNEKDVEEVRQHG